MNKIFPVIGASLMLAANVLTAETQVNFFPGDRADTDEEVQSGMNMTGQTDVDENGQGASEPIENVEQIQNEGGRIIIYDNDYIAPRYEKTPFKIQ